MSNKRNGTVANAKRILESLPTKTDTEGNPLSTNDPVMADILMALALSNIALAEEKEAERRSELFNHSIKLDIPFDLQESLRRYLQTRERQARSDSYEIRDLKDRIFSLESNLQKILRELANTDDEKKRGIWERLTERFR